MPDFKSMFSPEQSSSPDYGSMFAPEKQDQGQFIRSELFPIKHNPVTGETRLAYPGVVKELAGLVKSAIDAPQAYDPTTGQVHTSPEMIKAGVQTALMATPGAPEVEATTQATRTVVPEIAKTLSPMERTARIKAEAGAGIQAAKESGVTVPASEARDLLNQIKSDTKSEYNKHTHDAAKGFFKKFEDTLKPIKVPKGARSDVYGGVPLSDIDPALRAKLQAKIALTEPQKNITVKDLHDLRQELNDVHNHAFKQGYGQEGKVASKAKEAIDTFLADKMDQFGWSKDMRNYALSSTAEEIKQLVDRALYRKTNLSQGQRAAALNTELRQWARPTLDRGPNARMRMLRKLSPQAADQMEALATAKDPRNDILKILGTAAPTSVLPFVLDEYAGHLFNVLLGTHLGPVGVMGVGAAAKYMAGRKVMRGINDIIETLNNEAEFGDKVGALEQKVGGPVAEAVSQTPAGNRALKAWAKSATPQSARVLAFTIARTVKRPDLAPRIQQELENMDQENGRTDSVTPTVAPTR